MKKIFAMIVLFCQLTYAAPGGDVIGNGGDGVVINGQLYLLDLVEFGNFRAPYFDPSSQASASDIEQLNVLEDIPVDRDLIARKIAEIRKQSPLLAEVLLQGIRMYSWHLAAYELIDVGDENTVVNLPRTQIAVRSRKTILVSETEVTRLDAANRVALVFHEAIYALIRPKKITGEKGSFEYQQSSVAREINSYIFSKKLSSRGLEGLEKIVRIESGGPYLPIDEYIAKTTRAKVGSGFFFDTEIEFTYFKFSQGLYPDLLFARGVPVSEQDFVSYCARKDESLPKLINFDLRGISLSAELKFDEISTPDGRQMYLKFGSSYSDADGTASSSIEAAKFIPVPGQPGYVYEPRCVKFLKTGLSKLSNGSPQ